MQVKLRVIGGKNDGREIPISVPEFVIGRGEGTHLRPQSDLISRKHCALVCQDGKAIIQDFGSRNGTFVNGERVEGERQLKVGDELRVGRLHFEVQIDHAAAGSKKPKVEGVREAAIRAASGVPSDDVDEDSITDWLMEADQPKRPQRRSSSYETRQFVLDETDHGSEVEGEAVADEPKTDEEKSTSSEVASEADTKSGKKKEPGKLPPRPKSESVDSRDAASQVLRQFFNRR